MGHPMELLLIRHARPARTQVDTGPADPSLTDLGHRQAVTLASWLAEERVDGLYTSPLRRAVETTAPIASKLGLTPQVDPALSEYDADASSYVPIEELQAAGDARAVQPPEDLPGFQRTVVEGIERVVEQHPSGKVAVVCHGGVINVYLSWVLETAQAMFFLPHYTSVSRVLAAGDGRRTVDSLNEIAHLRIAGIARTEF